MQSKEMLICSVFFLLFFSFDVSYFCSRRLSVEQMMRAKRVPATASVTMTSHMCEDVSYDTHIRTEKLYLHGDLPDPPNKTVETFKAANVQGHVQGKI